MYAATRKVELNITDGVLTATICFLVLSYSIVVTHWLTDTTGKSSLYLLIVIQLTPILICFARGHYNFLAFIMVVNFLTYSVGKYNTHIYINKSEVLDPIVLLAINTLIKCSILTIMGYFFARVLFPSRRYEGKFKPLFISKIRMIQLCLFIAAQYLITPHIPSSLALLYYVATGLASIILLCSQIPGALSWEIGARIFLTANAVINFAYSGSMGALGYFSATLFLVSCLNRRILNIVPILFLVLTLICFQTVKSDFRDALRSSGYSLSITQRLNILGDLLHSAYLDDPAPEELQGLVEEIVEDEEIEEDDESTSDLLASGLSRIGDGSLERVLSWTPERVPYWSGKTYQNIPFMMIPRLIWPDKPKWTLWNEFGRTYGILSSNDFQTSVSINFLGEAYMNFGYLWMYAVALLFGILAAIVEKLSYLYLKESNTFVYVWCLAPLLMVTSHLGTILNSLIIMACVLVFLKPTIRRWARIDIYA